jgi:hypothetical protein
MNPLIRAEALLDAAARHSSSGAPADGPRRRPARPAGRGGTGGAQALYRLAERIFWLLSLAALLPMASAQWLAAHVVRSASVFRVFIAELLGNEIR